MKWLRRLWRRAPTPEGALEAQRLVVVDVESSGLDPRRDRLISIGAVAVTAGTVRLSDAFATTLRQERPSSGANILVHRIGGSAQMEGRDPAGALADFLDYAGKAPLVAFNADFDRVFIERAARAALGVVPHGPWLDLAALAPALLPDLARNARALDDWLQAFAIENYARHDALADALATAQLLLPVLAAARIQGLATCARLQQLQRDYLWLGGGRA